MNPKKESTIINLASEGQFDKLKDILGHTPSQRELNIALENSLAYSFIDIAEFALSKGASFSFNNYEGSYYAVHNNELNGLKFLISKGVDINVNNGMLLNTSILTSINTNDFKITKWLILNGADKSLLSKQSLLLINKYGSNKFRELLSLT